MPDDPATRLSKEIDRLIQRHIDRFGGRTAMIDTPACTSWRETHESCEGCPHSIACAQFQSARHLMAMGSITEAFAKDFHHGIHTITDVLIGAIVTFQHPTELTMKAVEQIFGVAETVTTKHFMS